MNMLLAHIWNKGLKISKHILMEVHECKTWALYSKKLKKHHSGFISSQTKSGQAEKKEKKKKSFRSIPTRPGLENSQKNSKNEETSFWHYF